MAVVAIIGLEAAVASPGANFAVNSMRDGVDANVGNGSCATATGTCTLRAAIQEANALPGSDVIELSAGTYEIEIPPLNQNDVTTGDLDITDSVTISGAGAATTIVDAGIPTPGAPPQVPGLDRIFEVAVDGGTVDFSGLTLRDGYATEYGGAIAGNSTATITVAASVLTGNVAGKAGGAIDNHFGGAVHVRDSTVSGNFANENGSALNNNRDGTLTVTDSTVSSNSAAAVGLDEALAGAGAISNNAELDTRGTIEVTGSQVFGNRAGGGRSGATISNDGTGAVTVDQTTFSDNIAIGDGGAIFNGAGEVTVRDSTFAENAARDGGAVYNDGGGGFVTVLHSSFANNTASARGGAVASTGAGVLTISDSTFSGNGAGDWGGAVLNDDKGSATILNSTFRENSGLNGGGFANEGTGLVTVEASTFTHNSAAAGAVLAGGEGGGLHSNSVGAVVINGGEFSGNAARGGGGLSNEGGGTLEITGTRFSANRADEQGGGILIQSGALRMVDIDVVGNSASSALEGGGGISYQGDKLVAVGESAAIEDSRIRDNTATGPGGGIDSRGDGPLAITTTAITGNTAATGGGIHHVGDAPLDLTRSTLSGNVGDSGGGLFSDGDGEAVIENSTISGNRARGLIIAQLGFGGGLLVSSRVTLRNSTVANNSAASGGGINNGGGDLVGDGSVFLANTIVANSPTGDNCRGTMTSLGGNVDSADSCQFRELSDQPGTAPRLGPLASNGGPTQTHGLLAGSPAQEKAVCTDLEPCPPIDQRGVARPQFDGFDAGAYESESTPGGSGGQPCAGRIERPLPAESDSWVAQSAPASNFGGDATLKVESKLGANDRALVDFALPAVPPGCKLVAATLRLYSSSATESHDVEALRITSAWSEFAVTWANQPGTAGPASTTPSGNGLREWDVLAQARDMYTHGAHGFLIRDAAEGGSGEQSFHSREKGDDHPPELVLVFDDPDAPPQPGACPTTPQSVPADQDSWVSQGSPSNNFGNDSTLKVKTQVANNSRALVRFRLPALPSGCTSIGSATLRIDAASGKEGHTLEALQVAAAWAETGVTWNNQPPTTGSAATTPSAEGPLEWSVTPQVGAMYASANHGFLIRHAAENGVGDEQTLNSRDKLTDNPPELEISFDDSTPETTIDSGPHSPTTETTAEFSFSSDEADATFECSLDGAAFGPCSSPYPVSGLAEGDHTFRVRATRGVTAVDPSPARFDWKVAVPPDTTVTGPASPSSSPNATLTFAADEPATFECSLNDAPFMACTSPVQFTNLPDGRQSVRIRATDQLGNAESEPAEHTWTVAVPPVTTITDGPPNPSNSATASFSFTADEPATFECALDAGAFVACTSPAAYTGLADGEHRFRVRATDRAGNIDAGAATHVWTVDTIAPDTTAPQTTIDEAPPTTTASATASFTFSADEPGSTFECALDEAAFAACGSPVAYTGLSDGEHTFQVRATDEAGNRGEPVTHAWTVDTIAPVTTIGEGPADPSRITSASFAFAADEGAELECALDDGAFAACGSPAVFGDLGDGAHAFQVRATDRAGNRGEHATYTWTVDATAPAIVVTDAPTELTKDTSASFAFAADEPAGFECALDTGAFTTCDGTAEYADLAEGRHEFRLRATDRAGNQRTASHAWTIDTTAPVATISEGPADPTRDTSASFAFAAGEPGSTFECALDVATFGDCPAAYTSLPDGAHTFQVRATDKAGNQGEAATYSWTIDTTAPVTTISAGPADLTRLASASFTFAADEAAELVCALDAGAFAACSSPAEYRNLSDGRHQFQVRASDEAGNLGDAATYSWTVDTTAPAIRIAEGPADPAKDTSASFTFDADEPADFECALDAAAFAACGSPVAYDTLTDGRHTLEVRATDEAGNSGEAVTYSWTIDTVAPVTTISAGPADPAKDTSASFTFGADESATFKCALDAEAFGDCPVGYSNLADGRHTFRVRASDTAGNEGVAASYTWTVDATAPAITIGEHPADPTNETTASFAFGADEAAMFECALDAGAFAACDSRVEYTGLRDGVHEFRVRATDRAGNVRAAAHSWSIDTVAPTATITGGPADPSNETTASFRFGADEPAELECAIDAGAFTVCSDAAEYTALSDGRHTFQVRATDTAGNDGDAATYTWTIDTTAPSTTITERPADPTNATTADFSFVADETAEYECALDAGAFAACSSPVSYTGLADGRHTFQVRASDEAGNRGAPAAYSWTVESTAPSATIVSGPAELSRSATAKFVFAADELAAFECALDTQAFAVCASPVEYAALAAGRHTFRVRASDVAGNRGEPATYTWTIDTTEPDSTIDERPPASTTSTSARFTFAADEPAEFECALDSDTYTRCSSPVERSGLALGAHEFRVRATDAAGNLESSPAIHRWTIQTPPDVATPDTTIAARPAALTNAGLATFGFTGSDDATPPSQLQFRCRLDNQPTTDCTSPTHYTGLNAGSHTFEVRAVDRAGNADTTPATHTWTIDTTPPQTAISSGPASPTKDTFASFTFGADESAAFECALDAEAFGDCPAEHTGLADGAHTFRVRAVDEAGNEGVAATYRWIVDATAPEITIGERPADRTNQTAASFGFSAGEPAGFECALDAGAFAACGSPIAFTGLADGVHEFRVRATDEAGNVQAAAYVWSIDTVAPTATITGGPADPTKNTSASFRFGADEPAELECAIDADVFTACSDTAEYTALTPGTHTFQVRATDRAGNHGASAAYSWTVDTIAPSTTITGRPADPTNATTADFAFVADETAEFECALDAGTFAACSSPVRYTDLPDGEHTFQVRGSDGAGNRGATAAYSWTVESTSPSATIISGPADPSRQANARFVFSADEPADLECALDAGAFVACGSPLEYSSLADGRHSFHVRATDTAGNQGEDSTYTWTIDTTAPATTFDERPPASTTSTSARFTFAADEPGSTLECALDSGAYTACTSPVEHSGLALGAHEFRVRATDAAGNEESSPALHQWTIETPPDVAPPDTSITARPADLTNAGSATFSFTGSDDKTPPSQLQFRCRLDSQTADCTSPTVYAGLSAGTHTFEVRAVDLAGNADATPATHTWTIDTTAPQTTIGSGPTGPTADATPTIEFSSEPGATFACRVDTGPFAACSSPHTTAELADGTHNFEVRATDTAGNTDASPASRTITVDTTAPQTTITAAPPATTTSTTAEFNFSAEPGSTLECSLDGSDFVACSSPVAYTGLADGRHTFRVRATDRAGNTDAADHSWTVSAGDASADPANSDAGSGDQPGGGGGATQSTSAGAAPDTSAPDVKLRAPSSIRASALRRGGAKLAVTASEDGRVVAQLRTAGGRVLARANATARAGQRTFVRLRARGMAGRRLTLRVTAVDLAGNRRTISRPLRVTAG